MRPLARILERLPGARPSGDQFTARCPGHADTRASLTVGTGADGRVLLRCHAGCTVDHIVGAVGLTMRDLYPAPLRAVDTSSKRTVYRIKDAAGRLIAEHVRRDHADGTKTFAWRRNGNTGLDGMPTSSLPLYGSDRLVRAGGRPVVVVEGEKARDALAARALIAVATVTGAAGTPDVDVLRVLADRDVVLWPDADDIGRDHMRRIAERLATIGVPVRWLEIPDAAHGDDAADLVAPDDVELERLIGAAPPWMRDVVASPTPSPKAAGSSTPDLNGLLGDVERFVTQFIVLPQHAGVAVALWIAHAHALEAFDVTPYLNVYSPEPRCGKTLLLELLELLTPRAWHAIQPTEAVLFRRIERDCPTLLLDEVDTLLKERSDRGEAIRGLLNAGNRRGVPVSRCVGRSFELTDFAVFCAKVLAGIGALPSTVADRAIPVRMARRKPDEGVTKFRRRRVEPNAVPLRAALERWGATIGARLRGREPLMPDVLHDRAADAWEPLLTVADEAGGDWPRRAREAAVALHGREDQAASDEVGPRTLSAIRDAFDQAHADELLTTEVLAALVARDDGPWAAWWGQDVAAGDLRGKGPAFKLAQILKRYAVKSLDLRRGERHGKGYRRHDFTEAWSRYLPSPDADNALTGQVAPDAALRVNPKRDTPPADALTRDAERLGAQGLSRCRVTEPPDGLVCGVCGGSTWDLKGDRIYCRPCRPESPDPGPAALWL